MKHLSTCMVMLAFLLWANHTQAQLNTIPVGTSGNLVSVVEHTATLMDANNSLNSITFTHRSNPSLFGGGGSMFRFDVSKDGGNTWTNDLGPITSNAALDNTAFARYPQGVIFNPTGNTIADSAYLIYSGTYHDNTYWDGQVRGRGKLTGNTATFNTSLDLINNGHTVIGSGLCQGDANTLWAVNMNLSSGDFNGTPYIYSGVSVQKGTYNPTTRNVTWATTNLPATFATNAAGGVAASWNIAFDPTGQKGWICVLGDLTNDADSVYNPIFWQTTNGGNTWTGPITVDLDNVPGVKMVLDSFNSVDGSLTSLRPTTAFDADLAVDVNGNPHLLVLVGNGAGHSLQYSAYDMWDITYTATGSCNWRGNYLDRMYTMRGTYTTDGQNDDNRPQICRTPDGTKLFFLWNKTDAAFWQSPDNTHPNLYCAGIDVTTGTRTAVYSMTEGDPVWGAQTASYGAGTYGGSAYYLVSAKALVSSGTYTIPTIFPKIDYQSNAALGLGDGNQPVQYYYTTSYTFNNADFQYYTDLVPPTISLNGSNPMNLTVGQTYSEPGATATDCVDGSLNVTISGTVNTNVAGTYNVTYTAIDAAGNTDTVIRVVNVTGGSSSAPTVVTTAATAVTTNSATLNGTVNANGLVTTTGFEYGLTTSYGNGATATPGTLTGVTTTSISGTASGLQPNTTYHYRAVATSSGGTTYGNDVTFTTNAQAGPCTPNSSTTQGLEPKAANVNCITQGTAFSQVYTFVVPSSVDPGIGTPVSITNMTIDSIVNLPTGLTWVPGVTPPVYAGGTSGCFTVSGTTNAPCGQYTMLIYVTVNTGFGPFSGELTTLTQQFATAGFDREYLRVISSGNSCPAVNTSPSGNFVAYGTCGSGTTVTVTTTKTDANCFGQASGTATATATGGSNYSYVWSNGQVTQTATNLAAGTYTVTVTSNGSTTATASVTVSQPTQLSVATSSTPTACAGSTGTVSATPTGGTPAYTTNWSSGSTTNLAAGTYTVTVTDSKGCTVSNTATVAGGSGNMGLTTNVTPVSCFGASTGSITAVVSGNNGTVTYNWSTANGNGASAFNLPAGVVNITATDASGCSASASATVTQPASAVVVSATSTGTSCIGSTGTATATGNGGTSPYTFNWNNGQNGANISNLAGGNYTVTITDNKGCTATATTTVSTPANFTVTVAATAVSCYGQSTGSVTANVSGATGTVTYLWNTQANTPTLSNLAAGNYNVTVTDGSGCSKSASGTVTQPAQPLAVTIATTSSACGSSTGSATATVTGNNGNITYVWSNGGGNAAINNLAAGIYNLTVSAGGCSVTGSAAVNNSNGPAVNVLQNNPTCFGSNNGSATAVATGGQAPYSYVWNTAATGSSISNLIAGTYTVIVTDNSGCAATHVVTLVQPGAITFNPTITNVNCYGAQTGAATVIVGGGTGPYQYSWSNGTGNATISNLAAGPFTLTVTDSRSCTAINTVNITQPAQALTANVTGTPTTGNDGTATALVSGGTSPYQYSWSNSQTTQTVTGLQQGTVNVTVTDSKGCTVTGSHSIVATGIEETLMANTAITVYPNPASDVLNVSMELSGTHNISVNITDATGKAVYTSQQVQGGSFILPVNTSQLAAGVYMVQIGIDKHTAHRRFVVGR